MGILFVSTSVNTLFMVVILIQYQTNEIGFLSEENRKTLKISSNFYGCPTRGRIIEGWCLQISSTLFTGSCKIILISSHVALPINTIISFWAIRRHLTFWQCDMTLRFCRRISWVYYVLPLRWCLSISKLTMLSGTKYFYSPLSTEMGWNLPVKV